MSQPVPRALFRIAAPEFLAQEAARIIGHPPEPLLDFLFLFAHGSRLRDRPGALLGPFSRFRPELSLASQRPVLGAGRFRLHICRILGLPRLRRRGSSRCRPPARLSDRIRVPGIRLGRSIPLTLFTPLRRFLSVPLFLPRLWVVALALALTLASFLLLASRLPLFLFLFLFLLFFLLFLFLPFVLLLLFLFLLLLLDPLGHQFPVEPGIVVVNLNLERAIVGGEGLLEAAVLGQGVAQVVLLANPLKGAQSFDGPIQIASPIGGHPAPLGVFELLGGGFVLAFGEGGSGALIRAREPISDSSLGGLGL